MADIDKLLGMRDDTRVYGAYRIDYDHADDIRYDHTDGATTFRFEDVGAVKVPSENASVHGVKAGYQRKAIVEDAAARDAVTAYLDAEDITYTVEDISPTGTEKTEIETDGAETCIEAKEALSTL